MQPVSTASLSRGSPTSSRPSTSYSAERPNLPGATSDSKPSISLKQRSPRLPFWPTSTLGFQRKSSPCHPSGHRLRSLTNATRRQRTTGCLLFTDASYSRTCLLCFRPRSTSMHLGVRALALVPVRPSLHAPNGPRIHYYASI